MPEFDNDEDACAFADQEAAEYALHSTSEYQAGYKNGYEDGLADALS